MGMKICFLFMTIQAFSIVSAFDPENPYCSMRRCRRGTHTMCVYNNNRPHYRCNRVIRANLSDNERQKVLHVHNALRSRVFNGAELRGSPGPQPAAMSDAPLVWNAELEMIAQRWANQCVPSGDRCRHIDNYLVGQNIIANDFDEDMNEEMELNYLEELIELWYNEVARFSRASVRRFRKDVGRSTNTLSYTQLIWEMTTNVGCGAIRFHKPLDPVPKILLVCNYGPTGNRDGYPVYERLE